MLALYLVMILYNMAPVIIGFVSLVATGILHGRVKSRATAILFIGAISTPLLPYAICLFMGVNASLGGISIIPLVKAIAMAAQTGGLLFYVLSLPKYEPKN